MKERFVVTPKDRMVIGSIVDKAKAWDDPVDSRLAIISFGELQGLLAPEEWQFIERIRKIDAVAYGARLPYLGITDTPEDLLAIRGQSYLVDGVQKPIPTQFLPKRTFDAYGRLNEGMTRDLGRKVLVESGYRSPACQSWVLTEHLQKFDYDVARVLSLVAPVYHSEHGHPPFQAIDLATIYGIGEGGVDERFEGTEEHEWLLVNAQSFGFRKSYPKNNSHGIAHESWHWSHRE